MVGRFSVYQKKKRPSESWTLDTRGTVGFSAKLVIWAIRGHSWEPRPEVQLITGGSTCIPILSSDIGTTRGMWLNSHCYKQQIGTALTCVTYYIFHSEFIPLIRSALGYFEKGSAQWPCAWRTGSRLPKTAVSPGHGRGQIKLTSSVLVALDYLEHPSKSDK